MNVDHVVKKDAEIVYYETLCMAIISLVFAVCDMFS